MLPSRYPIMAGGWYFPDMQRTLTRLIQANDYDLIVLEGIWMSIYWPILQRCRARKVLNLYDLEEHALARQANVLPPGFKRMLYRNGVRRMHHLENHLVREADHTWVVSEREKQELLARSPNASVEVAPNGVDSRRITPLLPKPDSREILFVGSLKYLPNIDGLKFFIHDVMPLLQERVPDVVLRVVGRGPGPEIRELHAPPHIEITGEVDDLEPYYRQCALTVVPLRSGGGTRLKILESMAYGRPVVSTTLGAEGLELEPERDLLIADQPEALAESIARLLNDPQARNAMAERARRQVEKQYDWAAIAQRMMTTYHQMLNNQR
jgi:glycosyltransferase involved in cell wall biosynthesis